MKNPILFIVDASNNFLRYTGTIRALNGYTEQIVFITPQPILNTYISASMLPVNRNENRYEQYVLPSSDSVSDYIETSDALYQTIADWNVFKVDIKQTALAEFSKFRSGNISFAFAIQSVEASSKLLTYKGVFGVDNPLPTTGQTIGDYYECEDSNFTLVSGAHTYEFSEGMYVYWNGSRWVKDRLITLGSTTSVQIPVEPNHAVGYELEDDESLAVENTIAQVVINENDIADLKQKDSDILDGTSAFTEISLDDGLGNIETITHASKVALDNEVARLETDKADKTYVDSQDNALGVRIDNVETNIDQTEADILALETANMIKSITRTGTDLITITYYDNTTATVITLAELKSFIGEATQSLSGLMSAQDKTDIDTLMALFDSDGDSVVNTIAEVLAIFENYPEGVDLVTALAGKVDKTTTVNGKALNTNITINAEDVPVTHSGTNYLDASDDVKEDVETLDTTVKAIDDRVTVNETDIDNLQAKDIEHNVKLAEHEHRIDSIEEATRKTTGDVASASDTDIISLGKDVAETTIRTQIDGLLLDAPQLVTNGDFIYGTTGWTSSFSTLSVIDNILIVTADGTAFVGAVSYIISGETVSTDKYNSNIRVRVTNPNATNIIIRYRGSTGGAAKIVHTITSPVENQWYYLSILDTLPLDATGDFRLTIEHNYVDATTANGKVMEVDYAYAFNLTPLISNKQYSPLYSTTFDLMSDAQIKAQMDLWVQNGTLPNSIQAVDFNKRLRSFGKNKFNKELYATNYAYKIKVEQSKQYTWNVSALYKTYDANMVEVSSGTATTHTMASNEFYIAFSGIADIDTFQLEEGSIATTYEMYRHTDLYIKGNDKGYSYQGTKDSVEFRDGVSYLIKRVNATQDGLLTTPIETEVATIGNAIAYPNGTVLVDDATIVMTQYTTKAQVDNTDYHIESLDEIYKLNDDGSKTKLDNANATIAGDGLSFTHTALSSGDMVIFSYFYQGTNIKGLTTVYYYEAEDDLRFPVTVLSQPASGRPDFDTTNIGLLFPQNNTAEVVYIVAQLPHDRVLDSPLEPHVHCRLSGAGQPVMKMDYKIYNPSDEAIPSSFTTYVMNENTATWTSGTISNMIYGASPISGVGYGDSAIMIIKLYRDDNVYSGDLLVDELDIHYVRKVVK